MKHSIKYQIMIAKVSMHMVFHTWTMDDSTLAKRIYIKQLQDGWPGLARQSILQKILDLVFTYSLFLLIKVYQIIKSFQSPFFGHY